MKKLDQEIKQEIVKKEAGRLEDTLKKLEKIKSLKEQCVSEEDKKWYNECFREICLEAATPKTFFDDIGLNDYSSLMKL